MLLYGPLDAVFDVLRLRAPRVESNRCDRGADGGQFLRVRYRGNGPRQVVWDDDLDTYRWSTGPDAPQPLGKDPVRAAESIAWALGTSLAAPP
ncbi:hypothetical protein [Actinomadura sp. NTSP31]|uniref:hypothetical protein n=1 Tax=Actinomadura sp. NTSP31 TaxID=1735447 RepID=UPI0035C124E8